MDQEIDDEKLDDDPAMMDLIHSLGLHNRRKVVSALLTGNDTQCFTSRQYAETYHRICHRNTDDYKENWIKWLMKLAHVHLRSVGAEEVKPGVWTKR